MTTPNNREEFERNFYVLAERMRSGLMHFSYQANIDGIKNVRFLPNGRIDFLTVNESARLMTNSAVNMPDMVKEQIKKNGKDNSNS